MNRYKYILFDLDGTLTDPYEGITKSVQYALNAFGIKDEPLEKLKKFIGPPLKESFMEFYGLDSQQADQVIAAIPSIEVDMEQNWNRRYRENMDRLKSGNLLEVARVVKSLMLRDAKRGLSTGERKMLHSAKQILISEIVLSQNSSYEAVEARINVALT